MTCRSPFQTQVVCDFLCPTEECCCSGALFTQIKCLVSRIKQSNQMFSSTSCHLLSCQNAQSVTRGLSLSLFLRSCTCQSHRYLEKPGAVLHHTYTKAISKTQLICRHGASIHIHNLGSTSLGVCTKLARL